MKHLDIVALCSLAVGAFFLTPRLHAAEPSPTSKPSADFVVAPPQIPDRTFTLTDFGAVGDFKTMNTDAFKKAIDEIEKAGGGKLIVPPGTYKTLNIVLTSHMELHLQAGATIKFPDTFADYGIPEPIPGPTTWPEGSTVKTSDPAIPPGPRPTPLIICKPNSTDIAITGPGTIDGSGKMFWEWSDKAARRYPLGRTVLLRPHLVRLEANRIHVDGITLTNSPMFHLLPRGNDILVENVKVQTLHTAPNTDAIDPAGERIIIRKCTIDTGDDNVAVQSGSTDVLIEDLTCLHGHGISIGSGTKNGVNRMTVRRVSFDGTDNGVRIKSYRGNGGEVQQIHYSDLTMKNVRRPFDFNMRYNGNAAFGGDVGPREAKPDQTTNIPNFHDISITNLVATGSPIAGRVIGIPESLPKNIVLRNVEIHSKKGVQVMDQGDLVMDNVKIIVESGEPVSTFVPPPTSRPNVGPDRE